MAKNKTEVPIKYIGKYKTRRIKSVAGKHIDSVKLNLFYKQKNILQARKSNNCCN